MPLSPFIKDYGVIFDQAFKECFARSIPETYDFRVMANEIFLMYVLLYHQDLKNWDSFTDKNFLDAADFLRNTYGFIDCFKPLNLGRAVEKNNSYYDHIRHFLENGYFVDIEYLENARVILKSKQKARNKKKRRS